MRISSVLDALCDPMRRLIFECVAARPHTAAELTRDLPISRAAVTQHLRTLREAGLVRMWREGRLFLYGAEPEGLIDLRAYVEAVWDAALEGAAFSRSGGEGGAGEAGGEVPADERAEHERASDEAGRERTRGGG